MSKTISPELVMNRLIFKANIVVLMKALAPDDAAEEIVRTVEEFVAEHAFAEVEAERRLSGDRLHEQALALIERSGLRSGVGKLPS